MLKQYKQAFTILELSIVLIIIGIIAVGITKGAGLITSSKINLARSLTSRSVVPQIDGLVAWYETSSKDSFLENESTNGATITNWHDISPNSIAQKKNKLVTKTGAVKYITKGISNIPSLQFSSKDDSSVTNLQLSSFYQGSTSQNTIFIIFQQMPRTYISSSDRWIIDSHSSASTTSIGYSDVTGVDDFRINAGSTTAYTSSSNSPIFIDNQSYITAIYFDGSYSKFFLNDVTKRVGDGYVNSNPGSNSINGLTVGSLKSDVSESRFVGLISEIIIYNRLLKEAERNDIFRYLSKKYSVVVNGI